MERDLNRAIQNEREKMETKCVREDFTGGAGLVKQCCARATVTPSLVPQFPCSAPLSSSHNYGQGVQTTFLLPSSFLGASAFAPTQSAKPCTLLFKLISM